MSLPSLATARTLRSWTLVIPEDEPACGWMRQEGTERVVSAVIQGYLCTKNGGLR